MFNEILGKGHLHHTNYNPLDNGKKLWKGETTIQAAPTTPAPSAGESAEQIYQARLKYDPIMAAMEMQTQQQYMPQQTELYSSLYNQYMPQMAQAQQATQQQLYPYQSQIVEQGAQTALNQLQNPQTTLMQAMEQQAMAGMQPNALANRYEQEALAGMTQTGYTPEQQSAIDAIRMRQAQGLSRQLRERSNLGGTLYGGRSQNLESQGLQELAQRYSAEDVDRIIAQRNQAMQDLSGAAQMRSGLQQQALSGAGQVSSQQLQARQAAQSALTPYMQILYPQVGTAQPQVSPYQYQSAVPGADTLYNAIYQASQPQYFATPQALGGVNLGILGRWGGATR